MNGNIPYRITGLWPFLALLTANVAHYAFLENTPQTTGVFLVLWGVMAIFQAHGLPLPQPSSETRSQKRRLRLLPAVLLERMKAHSQESLKHYNTLLSDRIFLLWVVCGGLYILWSLYVALYPSLPGEVLTLQKDISAFFEDVSRKSSAPSLNLHPPSSLSAPGFLIITALSMWIGRAHILRHAYFPKYHRLTMGTYSLLFVGALCIYVKTAHFVGTAALFSPGEIKAASGWGYIPVLQAMEILPSKSASPLVNREAASGTAGALFFYGFVCVPPAFIFVRTFFQRVSRITRLYALAGLCVLGLMGYADISLAYAPKMQAFWLPGWLLLITLWHDVAYRSAQNHLDDLLSGPIY